jgi:hypothetical protein
VERGQPVTHPSRQAEQVDLRHLTVTAGSQVEEPIIPQGHSVGPEVMLTARAVTARAEPTEPIERGGWSWSVWLIARIRDDADETVFGGRARRPAVGSMAGEPVVGQIVMDVVRIEQGHEDVDVFRPAAR